MMSPSILKGSETRNHGFPKLLRAEVALCIRPREESDMTGRLQCDLVMRGGITSGIVYPRAIAKLAETYDFRSIGGTSAGAIAATATAAAALGATGGEDPFQTRIKSLPEDLAKRSHEGKTVWRRFFSPNQARAGCFTSLWQVLHANIGC